MTFYASANAELDESFVCPTIAPPNPSFDASEPPQNAKDFDSHGNANSAARNWHGCKV